MAADWIPMRIDLRDDPAVIAISAATQLDPDAVTGKLLRLWGWANRQLRSGDAPVTLEFWIDQFVSAPGFASAMISAGWLTTKNGKLAFPRFDRWNSQSAKKRALTAERMRKLRDAKRDAPVTQKVTLKGEKRRGEKKNKPSPGPAEEKKPRPRDELFDAIAEATGSDPNTTGPHIGAVKKALLKADPPFTPAEVKDFAARIAELCPWTEGRRPTLGEIEKYIGLVRSGQGAHQPRKTGFRTQDDRTGELLDYALGAESP